MNAPQCAHCGLFTSWASDSYVNWGGPCDTEPPDESYMCPKCAIEDEEEQVRNGRVRSLWIPSKSSENAAKRLGWVKAGPLGASWSEYYAKDRVPFGYLLRDVEAPNPTPHAD